MRLGPWRKRSRSSDTTIGDADTLVAETQSVRDDLLATAARLSDYTHSLTAEIERLKTLAQRSGPPWTAPTHKPDSTN